jgi:hypothetical protein
MSKRLKALFPLVAVVLGTNVCTSAETNRAAVATNSPLAPEIIFVPKGTSWTLDTNDIVIPPSRRVGTPVWTGPNGLFHTGLTFSVDFDVRSTSRTDYKTIELNWGQTQTIHAMVYEARAVWTPLDQFPGRSQTNVMVGEGVELSFTSSPPVTAAEAGGLRWMVAKDHAILMNAAEDGTAETQALGDGTLQLVVTTGGLRDLPVLDPGFSFSGPVGHGELTDADQCRGAYSNELKRIQQMRRAKDLAGLEKLGLELEQNWSKDTNRYLGLMPRIIYDLGAYGLDYDRQFVLEQKFARQVLDKIPQLPPGLDGAMLPHLLWDLEYARGEVKGEAWAKLRRAKAQQFLQGWQRAHQAVDWSYDRQDPKNWVVRSSDVEAFPAGDDQKLQAWLAEKARREAANAEKSARQMKQIELRLRFEMMSRTTEKYLVNAYSKPPAALPELKAALDEYMTNQPVKLKITSEAARRAGYIIGE